MTQRFISCGKQVLRNGQHYAGPGTHGNGPGARLAHLPAADLLNKHERERGRL